MPVFRSLMIGDVVGQAGLRALFYGLPILKKQYKVDLTIVNGENAADGFGITPDIAANILNQGADVITSGNHIWQRDEIKPYLESSAKVLRPINFPSPAPGSGVAVVSVKNIKAAVINAQGRTRMNQHVDCPFKACAEAIKLLRKETKLIFIDFHAEDTLEKEAIAFYLDGKATAVVGTHTHVQTMDEIILPHGTAYLSDLGMTGAKESVIGSSIQISIERSLTQMPVKQEPAEGNAFVNGCIIEADTENGKAQSVQRFSIEV